MIGRALRRLSGATSGAAGVEFAMISVVLIVTVVGAIEIGRAVGVAHTLERATQEAARYAYTGATDAEIEAKVVENLTGIDSTAVTRSIALETVDGATYKTIQASYVFQSVLPVVPINGTITRRTRVPQ